MAKQRAALLKAGLFVVLFLASIFSAVAAETININRDGSALDLTEAVSIFRDRGQTFQVTTAPDAEGIVRTIEVQANNPETAGDWAVLVLANTTDTQIDRLIVAPHFRLVGSGLRWP
ncbi:MAG: sensor domain-containing phosphodiesterase, partial [Pseudomonadota bacterium]